MAKIMKRTAVASFLATVLFTLLYRLADVRFLLPLAITAGTVAYHFSMRLAVGTVIDGLLHNQVDHRKRWFRVSETEMRFYRAIRIKKWKRRMPTYAPEVFDPARHSWDEIARAMCQSELVHEVIVLLSFLPIVASVWFGELAVFLITSSLSAAFDLLFVFMQRFNRTRILRLHEKQRP